MSEYSEDEQDVSLAKVLGRYKSTKGDADKRKETSKINMAKARAAKLSGLKQKKQEEENEYEVENSEESDESEEESDDEDLIITKKKPRAPQKGKGRGTAPPAAAPSDPRMDRLEAMLLKLAVQGKKKAKKPVRKTVIQVAAPAAAASAPVSNPKAEQLKHNILRFG